MLSTTNELVNPIVGDFLVEAFRTDRFEFPVPGESCDMTPGHWNWPLILEAKPK
jgi:hypothetical protein